MDVDHDIGKREKNRGEAVRNLAGDRALGLAWESAVHVHAIQRRKTSPSTRGRKVEGGDQDDPPFNHLRIQFSRQPHDRDLPLVLVAMIPCKNQDRGASALRDDGDRNEDVGPSTEVVRVRDLEKPLLFARFFKNLPPVGLLLIFYAFSILAN